MSHLAFFLETYIGYSHYINHMYKQLKKAVNKKKLLWSSHNLYSRNNRYSLINKSNNMYFMTGDIIHVKVS